MGHKRTVDSDERENRTRKSRRELRARFEDTRANIGARVGDKVERVHWQRVCERMNEIEGEKEKNQDDQVRQQIREKLYELIDERE